MSKVSVSINPRTAGRGYVSDPAVWAIVAGVVAGAAGTKATARSMPGIFGTADTAAALSRRELAFRAALDAGVAVAGAAISELGGIGRPVGLGVYAIGLAHLIGRGFQVLGLDVI